MDKSRRLEYLVMTSCISLLREDLEQMSPPVLQELLSTIKNKIVNEEEVMHEEG